jgi:ABC-type Zn2+ transport system substrate-binding protein/surface adhesin
MCVFKLSLESSWVGVGVGSPTDKPIDPAGEKSSELAEQETSEHNTDDEKAVKKEKTHKDKKKHKKHKKHKEEHDSDAHEDLGQATVATQSTTPHPF